MTIKMSWGARVAVLYGGFVALMVTLVTLSMHQKFDLVSKDYYAEEIAYQKTIDASKNQAVLSAPVTFTKDAQKLSIGFPAEFVGKTVNAHLLFYAPVDASKDKKFNIATEDGQLTIDRDLLKPGSYQLKLNWESNGKQYYQEEYINLSK